MRFQYRVYKAPSSPNDCGVCDTFGLRCYTVSSGTAILVCEVEDVSPDLTLVEALAAKCTAEQLEPEHLWDVVCDTLP